MAGTYVERQRCRDYLNWLLTQLKGAVTVKNVSSRDDCTEMYIPANCTGWVMGNRGSELRRVEKTTGVFSFMAMDDAGEERLLIFGHDAGSKTSDTGRMAAERMVNDMIQDKLRGEDRDRSDSRPRNRSRTPRRRNDSRSPPPRRRNDSRQPKRRASPSQRRRASPSPRRRASPPPRRRASPSPRRRDPPPRRRDDSRDRGG